MATKNLSRHLKLGDKIILTIDRVFDLPATDQTEIHFHVSDGDDAYHNWFRLPRDQYVQLVGGE